MFVFVGSFVVRFFPFGGFRLGVCVGSINIHACTNGVYGIGMYVRRQCSDGVPFVGMSLFIVM